MEGLWVYAAGDMSGRELTTVLLAIASKESSVENSSIST